MKRIALVIAVAALVSAQGAFAQSSGGLKARTYDLTIMVDAYGAEIYVDNVRIPGTVARVAPGVHAVRIRVEGSYDYTENVNVTADRTLVVRMKPRTYPVTVRVNVPGAAVSVDGQPVAGTVASVSAGVHSLQVSADGYEDSVMSINVAAPMVVDVTLERSGFLLSVNANVRTARVIIDGVSRGSVPFSEYLPPGTYTVRVTARGYTDYVSSIALDGPVTITANLQQGLQPGGTALLSVVVPAEYLDPDLRERDLADAIRIYVDGRMINQKRELEKIPVASGRHSIRIVSGALSVDMGEVEFVSGTSYTFELAMDVGIRAERKARNY
jgi:hypothetical protein